MFLSGDRIVRTCAREDIRKIEEVRKILAYEVKRYNEQQVHSTTGEMPVKRLERAIKEGKALLRPFKVPYPYESTKDVFCIKEERTTNAYRRVSFEGIELKVSVVNPHERVELRMVPDEKTGLTEIRFWYKGRLLGTQKIKSAELKSISF